MSERVGWKRNAGLVGVECCGTNFPGERGCNELWRV